MRRRRLTTLLAMVVMAALMVASAMPAFAQNFLQANPHSSCVGQMHSSTNQFVPGNPGTAHKVLAHKGINGQSMSRFAHVGNPGSPTRNDGAFIVGDEGGDYGIACVPG